MAGHAGQRLPTGRIVRDQTRARGVTLIEVMLAVFIFSLMVLALFEGIAVAARVARENAEYLQADAYAFDLAWKRCNESYLALRNLVPQGANAVTFPDENIARDAAPMLHGGAPPVSRTRIVCVKDPNDESTELGLLISVDVEWGVQGARRRRSGTDDDSAADYSKWVTVFKSGSEDG